tara:strand:- start:280 stop:789 length:510 start_codon:yes stop_codon:yes gene_type:complete
VSANRLYERVARDPALGELRDGNTRYFLMRADAFMDAFARLDEDARYTMFAAFAASIAKHAGQSVKHYRHELGPAAREIFLNAAVNLAADMGWGAWKFGPSTPGEIALEVRNSPFAEGYGKSDGPVCAPILGMIEALGGIVFAVDPACEEHECAAVSGGEVCRFVARLA